ncbi:hypothetical protein IQ07DRAFT_112814 [Pyrenochaeta sp. DS3sAY3a]|nr:hypothetical protein IQ07DRAFT_112814 [Pyrenochaeta sp. DS3sAY3a]
MASHGAAENAQEYPRNGLQLTNQHNYRQSDKISSQKPTIHRTLSTYIATYQACHRVSRPTIPLLRVQWFLDLTPQRPVSKELILVPGPSTSFALPNSSRMQMQIVHSVRITISATSRGELRTTKPLYNQKPLRSAHELLVCADAVAANHQSMGRQSFAVARCGEPRGD